MQTGNFLKTLSSALLVLGSMTTVLAQRAPRAARPEIITTGTLLRIMQAEDERRWDVNVLALLGAQHPIVRKRAALALGRIGDERAVPALADVMKKDADTDVRQMAAFAIGEIEPVAGTDALIAVLDDSRQSAEVRARAVEALGKIGAALLSNSPPATNQGAPPRAEDQALARIRLAILGVLKFEAERRSMPDRLTILLGLTAALRTRPEGAGPIIIRFLSYADPRIVADALNAMARLRLKDARDQVRQLLGNGDALVRANAARVIGAAEDKGAYDDLLARALNDNDLRVRVSAIRSLGSLKDARATAPLLRRAQSLTAQGNLHSHSSEMNEALELATTLSRINQKGATPQPELVTWLSTASEALGHAAPELEIAHARVSPEDFVVLCSTNKKAVEMLLLNWKAGSSMAQGLKELATTMESGKDDNVFAKRAETVLRAMLDYRNSGLTINTLVAVHSEYAIPDVLQALAAFKPKDMGEVLGEYLKNSDVIIRGTAADLLGSQPANETSTRALIEALPVALQDRDLNDAAMSILDALAKQKSPAANDAIKTALDSSDYLIRRRAVALLKANGVGDFTDRIGPVRTRNTEADYRRAIARIGKRVTATVSTNRGVFIIDFLPEESPLTVDNFVQLARRGYFNGQTIPRVVPNFVIQTGDPRGDQNGGPGYQIRCEINEAQYERGAVGMALSGKDTGGSQWFVTHSPQPHLDGGYTVFGRVIRGMEVVDSIARGDTIVSVVVNDQ